MDSLQLRQLLSALGISESLALHERVLRLTWSLVSQDEELRARLTDQLLKFSSTPITNLFITYTCHHAPAAEDDRKVAYSVAASADGQSGCSARKQREGGMEKKESMTEQAQFLFNFFVSLLSCCLSYLL